jgi:hypothetical protein
MVFILFGEMTLFCMRWVEEEETLERKNYAVAFMMLLLLRSSLLALTMPIPAWMS